MDDDGFIGCTRSLSPKILLHGYSRGCFPWSEGPARWYCPDPRAVFEIPEIHFSRRLMRLVRQKRYRVTYDEAFAKVMRACATVHGSSWIGPEFLLAYTEFHRLGYAHSVEVWEEEDLVGGLYGVHLRRMFCGESMFHTRPNTSKVAFYYLVQKLRELGTELFDSQVMTPHTSDLGAKDMPREEFLKLVEQATSGEGAWGQSWGIEYPVSVLPTLESPGKGFESPPHYTIVVPESSRPRRQASGQKLEPGPLSHF